MKSSLLVNRNDFIRVILINFRKGERAFYHKRVIGCIVRFFSKCPFIDSCRGLHRCGGIKRIVCKYTKLGWWSSSLRGLARLLSYILSTKEKISDPFLIIFQIELRVEKKLLFIFYFVSAIGFLPLDHIYKSEKKQYKNNIIFTHLTWVFYHWQLYLYVLFRQQYQLGHFVSPINVIRNYGLVYKVNH